MRLRSIAAAATLVAAMLLSPASAPAADGRGCSRTYKHAVTSCTFGMKGTPITAWAESEGATAEVRVWVSIQGQPNLPPLVECSSRASGYTSCSDSFPDDTTSVGLAPHPLAPTVTLVCNFQGRGAWTYGCTGGDE